MNEWRGRLIAVVSSIPIAAGCGGPQAVPLPSYDSGAMAAKALLDYDANKDGKLDEQEMKASPALAEMAKTADTNNDKMLDRGELVARFDAYQESKVGVVDVRAKVVRGGRPVAGAVVTLVPEEFMLGASRAAKGTTIASGEAAFRADGIEHQGVNYGCYRVEVSDGASKGAGRYGKEVFGQIRGEWIIDLSR